MGAIWYWELEYQQGEECSSADEKPGMASETKQGDGSVRGEGGQSYCVRDTQLEECI